MITRKQNKTLVTVPNTRVLRKTTVQNILASDSDESISIVDKSETINKKKVTHRRTYAQQRAISSRLYTDRFIGCFLGELTDNELDIETKQAIREQTERDARIRIQNEREEHARIERQRKQHEYNGNILLHHIEQRLPVAFELVLETDVNSGEIIIEVDLVLVQYMKQHQGKLNTPIE
jgi:hypothetical protein